MQNKFFHKDLIHPDKSLNEMIKRYNLERDYQLQKIRTIWIQAVGNQIAEHTYPSRLMKTALYVDVDQPVWSTQLQMIRKDLKKRINDTLGSNIVDELFFRNAGSVKSVEKEEKNVSGEHIIDLSNISPEKLEEIEKSIQVISQMELRDALRELYMIMAAQEKENQAE